MFLSCCLSNESFSQFVMFLGAHGGRFFAYSNLDIRGIFFFLGGGELQVANR